MSEAKTESTTNEDSPTKARGKWEKQANDEVPAKQAEVLLKRRSS